MKGKISVLVVVVLSILSCSKAPLELTPQQEQQIALIAYGYDMSTMYVFKLKWTFPKRVFS